MGARHPRTARVLRRLDAILAMGARLGVAPVDAARDPGFPEAVRRCIACREGARCTACLADSASGDDPAAFCLNAAFFAACPRAPVTHDANASC